MQDPDNAPSYMHLADTKPSLLLKGDNPRLLDEWQMAPVLWDAVRFEVDKRSDTGQFIITGSAVPSDNSTAHMDKVTYVPVYYVMFFGTR